MKSKGHQLGYRWHFSTVVGPFFKKYRKHWMLSVEVMAEACLVSANTYRAWEENKCQLPIWAIDAFSAATDISVEKLLAQIQKEELGDFVARIPMGRVQNILKRRREEV